MAGTLKLEFIKVTAESKDHAPAPRGFFWVEYNKDGVGSAYMNAIGIFTLVLQIKGVSLLVSRDVKSYLDNADPKTWKVLMKDKRIKII
ncbi:MAG: hypothetical protein WC595_03435 [Candidatus Nanoarchaeia archaeon]